MVLAVLKAFPLIFYFPFRRLGRIHQTPEDPKSGPRTPVTRPSASFLRAHSTCLTKANLPRYCASRCASFKCEKKRLYLKFSRSSGEMTPGRTFVGAARQRPPWVSCRHDTPRRKPPEPERRDCTIRSTRPRVHRK